jgi:hypothetical protein
LCLAAAEGWLYFKVDPIRFSLVLACACDVASDARIDVNINASGKALLQHKIVWKITLRGHQDLKGKNSTPESAKHPHQAIIIVVQKMTHILYLVHLEFFAQY